MVFLKLTDFKTGGHILVRVEDVVDAVDDCEAGGTRITTSGETGVRRYWVSETVGTIAERLHRLAAAPR